jgi:hypothetical protein
VWDAVTDILSQSHLYKEEIKKEILRDGRQYPPVRQRREGEPEEDVTVE